MASKQLSESIDGAMIRAKSLISFQGGSGRKVPTRCQICYETTSEGGYRAKEGAELMTSILQVSLESICNAHGIRLPNRPSSERFVVCSSCESLTKYGSEILKKLEDLKKSLDNLRDQIAEKIEKGKKLRPAKRTIRTVTEYERLWPAICEVFHQAHTPCVVDLGLLSNEDGDFSSLGTSPPLKRKSPMKTPSPAFVSRTKQEQVTPSGSTRDGVSTRRSSRIQKAVEEGIDSIEETTVTTKRDSDFYVGDEINELVDSDGGDDGVASDKSPDQDEEEFTAECQKDPVQARKPGRRRNIHEDKQRHVRGYACLDCSKLFPSPDILKIHERETEHNGEDLNLLGTVSVEMGSTEGSERDSTEIVKDVTMGDEDELEGEAEKRVSTPTSEELIPLESLVFECDKCDKTLTYKDTKRSEGKFQSIEQNRSFMFSSFSELCSLHYKKCANVRLYKPVNRRAVLWKSSKRRLESARKNKFEALRKGEVEVFMCEHCNDEFPNMEDYSSHKQVHLSGEWTVCAVCQSNYQDDRSLQIHMSRVHGVERNEELRYTCKVCRETYNSDSIITDENIGFSKFEIFAKIHETNCTSNAVKVPSGVPQHKCRFCDAFYMTRSGLKVHEVKKHTKEFEYFCDQCGKGFVTNAHLAIHQKDHAGIRPFKCSMCPADFNHRTRLTEHMRLHTGERPCICTHCGAQFRTLAILRKHELTHAEPEEHSCPQCNKMYVSARKLEYHVNTVHLKRWIVSRKKSQVRNRQRKKKVVVNTEPLKSQGTVVIKILAEEQSAE